MIVLITGASSGFGWEAAKLCVAKGHRVIGCARRAERLQALQKELGDAFFPLPFDIADADALNTAFERLPEDWRAIDVLVNNAGLALGQAPAHESRLADWEQMIATNIQGLVRMTHKVLPQMVAKNRGQIINLSSTASQYAYYGSNVYGASKAFVSQFSMNLRADLIGTAVRVTSLEPGIIGGTEFSHVRFYGDHDRANALYRGFDNVTGKDIAELIVWLIELPAHININRLEVMPVAQTFAGLTVAKKDEAR